MLYVDECPHGEGYLPHLRRLVVCARPEAEVIVRKITTDAEAREARFLGSPTVRVEGRDVDPGAADRADFALACRIYRAEDEVTGTPPDIWVIQALSRTAE